MHRRYTTLVIVFLALAFFVGTAVPAHAQDGSDFGVAALGAALMAYFIILVAVVLPFHLILFWVYVWSADWVNRDCEGMANPAQVMWNTMFFLVFNVCFAIGFPLAVCFFGVGCIISGLGWLVPYICYVKSRNKLVDHPNDKVWTKRHLARKFGGKKAEEKFDEDPNVTGLPVVLEAVGKEQQENEMKRIRAQQSPGFNDARQIICEALYRQADAILMDFTAESVAIKHQIDGVWHADDAWLREVADDALAAMKFLAGLNPEDRRNRQTGKFLVKFDKAFKYNTTVTSQGTKTGERVVIEMQGKETPFEGLEDLGLPKQHEETIREQLNVKKGFVLLSAMPKNGLKSTTNVALRAADRFTREFSAIEDEQNRYETIENITMELYDSAKGQKPLDIMEDLFLKEPQVVACRDLVDGESTRRLLSEVDQDRLIISTVRAKDTAEALLRVLALNVPPAELAQRVTLVVNQRLIRKLCNDCKEAYQPNPKLLKQLGLPADKVKALYRTHQPDPEEKDEVVCPTCEGIGYHGRTSLFEVLVVDDNVRKVLATTPKLDAIRAAARQSGMRNLQAEGILLAARGVTSIEEVMRVMKQ